MPPKPAKENVDHKNGEIIPFKMHPRVFQALGSELVTSDVVAIIELVKNAYDAFAKEVKVRFVDDPTGALSLEIEDNGVGMTKSIIDDVWCVVATPYRQQNPISHKDGNERRTTGAKGLGRLWQNEMEFCRACTYLPLLQHFKWKIWTSFAGSSYLTPGGRETAIISGRLYLLWKFSK